MQDDSPFSERREATRDLAPERGGYSSEKPNEDTRIKRRICITTGFAWEAKYQARAGCVRPPPVTSTMVAFASERTVVALWSHRETAVKAVVARASAPSG